MIETTSFQKTGQIRLNGTSKIKREFPAGNVVFDQPEGSLADVSICAKLMELKITSALDEPSKEHQNDGSPGPDPSPALFIEPILSNILSYLSISDLLKCRHVCTEWNTQIVAHLVLKNLAVVDFQNEDQATCATLRRLRKFSSVMQSSRRIPFTKFVLGALPPRHLLDPVIKTFFQLVGPSMKYLEVEIPKTLDMLSIVQELSRLTPNLESLHLINVQTVKHPAGSGPPTASGVEVTSSEWMFSTLKAITYTQKDANAGATSAEWKAAFEAMPNLKKIETLFKAKEYPKYHNESNKGSPIEDSMLEGLKESGRMSRVKELRLSGLTSSTLSLLITEGTKQGIALQELHVKRITDLEIGKFEEFLETQQKTLIKLEIKKICETPGLSRPDRYNQRCHYIRLRRMECLKSISLKITIDGVFLKTKNPLQDIPELVKVNIPEILCDMAETMARKFYSPTVTDLVVRFHNGEWERRRRDHFRSPNTITSLGKMFPSVDRLTLSYPSSHQVKKLSMAWPELKHLNLNVRKEDCTSLKNMTSFSEMYGSFPSLSDLKKLETLSVTVHKEGFHNWFEHRLFINLPSSS